jgi:hypothetical protein
VVDHVNPLGCGGADSPGNMQWQTVAAGKAKDKTERRVPIAFVARLVPGDGYEGMAVANGQELGWLRNRWCVAG